MILKASWSWFRMQYIPLVSVVWLGFGGFGPNLCVALGPLVAEVYL